MQFPQISKNFIYFFNAVHARSLSYVLNVTRHSNEMSRTLMLALIEAIAHYTINGIADCNYTLVDSILNLEVGLHIFNVSLTHFIYMRIYLYFQSYETTISQSKVK